MGGVIVLGGGLIIGGKDYSHVSSVSVSLRIRQTNFARSGSQLIRRGGTAFAWHVWPGALWVRGCGAASGGPSFEILALKFWPPCWILASAICAGTTGCAGLQAAFGRLFAAAARKCFCWSQATFRKKIVCRCLFDVVPRAPLARDRFAPRLSRKDWACGNSGTTPIWYVRTSSAVTLSIQHSWGRCRAHRTERTWQKQPRRDERLTKAGEKMWSALFHFTPTEKTGQGPFVSFRVSSRARATWRGWCRRAGPWRRGNEMRVVTCGRLAVSFHVCCVVSFFVCLRRLFWIRFCRVWACCRWTQERGRLSIL